MSQHRIALLPGDGIGPEVTAAARQALEAVAALDGFRLSFDTAPVGGIAIDQEGDPLPVATLTLARDADAIFLGAVGGPKWSDPTATLRPEAGLLRLRAELGLFANLRPVRPSPALIHQAPIKADLLRGTDLLFVRELTGGLYFGARQEQGQGDHAFDTMAYTIAEVERVAQVAFSAAKQRRGRVASIDKANVLASMRLWRRTVTQVSKTHTDIALEHVLVDAAAMRLLSAPTSFDVVLAPNLFGDILSDEASVLAGSLGMLPSASLGTGSTGSTDGTGGTGLYEPVHGSAPDIAGQGKANPIAALLSAAMLLRHSLGQETSASRIEHAVEEALAQGLRTADLAAPGAPSVGTEEMLDAVLARL